jgi:hypothetical protein
MTPSRVGVAALRQDGRTDMRGTRLRADDDAFHVTGLHVFK